MTQKKTRKLLLLLLALVVAAVLVPAAASAEEALPEEPPREEAAVETEVPAEPEVSTEPEVPAEQETPAEPEQAAQPAAPVDDDGEPLLGTAPPMNKNERPDFKFNWADKIIPELGKEVGQYEVQEGEYYVLQRVLSDGKSNRMTKRLIYVDRVYEAPGIIWGTRRTIDYTDADTGEHRTQDISGWQPESVHLFVPETNRIQDKIAG